MKKGVLSTVILIIIFFAGLSLLLYPTVSDYWNSLHQSKTVAKYADDVTKLDNSQYEDIIKSARLYNWELSVKENVFLITDEDKQEYENTLDITGTGVMGYIEIPAINCSLPIYHGTDEAVLQVAIGHIEWSSLPVGGAGTHCVVSGHRGLPRAKLFTDLDKLAEGDIFSVRVLNETFTYEIDRILIVEPDELDALKIVPGEDLFTLVTCTPYGVNTHRLLVRGHRIETPEEAVSIHVTADAIRIDSVIVAPLVASPMLLVLLLWLMFGGKKKKK